MRPCGNARKIPKLIIVALVLSTLDCMSRLDSFGGQRGQMRTNILVPLSLKIVLKDYR